MEGLSLFNIGFRCENICAALKEYKRTSNINPNSLDDSLEIISDCFKMNNLAAESLTFTKYSRHKLFNLIFSMYDGKPFSTVMEDLNQVKFCVDEIRSNKRNVEIDKAVSFFNALSELCMSADSQINNFDGVSFAGVSFA
jgi:hypothetical protein